MSEENIFQKERRLKKRKQVYKETYKKGIYWVDWKRQEIADHVLEDDVLIKVINSGDLDDGTHFLTITIEGYKPKN